MRAYPFATTIGVLASVGIAGAQQYYNAPATAEMWRWIMILGFAGAGIVLLAGAVLHFAKASPSGKEGDALGSRTRNTADRSEGEIPAHWQGVLPEQSRFRIVSRTSDSIPLGLQTFSLEYGPRGHARPLNLIDGVAARAEVQFSCLIVNPYKAMFSANQYALDVLQPQFLVRAREILEKYSLASIRTSREEISKQVISALSSEFESLGVRLSSVAVGSVEQVGR